MFAKSRWLVPVLTVTSLASVSPLEAQFGQFKTELQTRNLTLKQVQTLSKENVALIQRAQFAEMFFAFNGRLDHEITIG